MIKLACVHVRVHELFLFGFRIIPGSDLLLRSLDEPNDQDELTLTVLTGDASAQSRTFYNTNGKVVGRSPTSSSGAVTMREAVAAHQKIFAVSKTRIAECNVGNGSVVCRYLTTGAFRLDCNRSLR